MEAYGCTVLQPLYRGAYQVCEKLTTPQSPNGASSPYTGEPIEVRTDLIPRRLPMFYITICSATSIINKYGVCFLVPVGMQSEQGIDGR